MSIQQIQTDLAAKLQGIDGVSPLATWPRTISVGVAWPEWTGSEPVTNCDDAEDFVVRVVLPAGDPWAALEFVDQVKGPIRDALLGMATIDRAERDRIVIGDAGEIADVLVFRITV